MTRLSSADHANRAAKKPAVVIWSLEGACRMSCPCAPKMTRSCAAITSPLWPMILGGMTAHQPLTVYGKATTSTPEHALRSNATPGMVWPASSTVAPVSAEMMSAVNGPSGEGDGSVWLPADAQILSCPSIAPPIALRSGAGTAIGPTDLPA